MNKILRLVPGTASISWSDKKQPWAEFKTMACLVLFLLTLLFHASFANVKAGRTENSLFLQSTQCTFSSKSDKIHFENNTITGHFFNFQTRFGAVVWQYGFSSRGREVKPRHAPPNFSKFLTFEICRELERNYCGIMGMGDLHNVP